MSFLTRPDCPAGDAWFHGVCGNWVQTHEFVEERHMGFLIAYVCPHCGGENPCLMDDGDLFHEEFFEYEFKPRNRDLNLESKQKRLRMWS